MSGVASRMSTPSCPLCVEMTSSVAALQQRREREDVADVVVDHQRLPPDQAGARRMRGQARLRRGGTVCTVTSDAAE